MHEGADAGKRTDDEVRMATVSDRDTIAATLIDAFAEDPVLSWVMPDRARRMRYGRQFFTQLGRRLIPDGLTFTVDGGAAVWASPGHWRESPADVVRLGLACLPGLWPRPLSTTLGLAGVEAAHPKERHLYLATVGVRRDRQGQGLGTRLMAPGLEQADARGLPCYLESSNPLNVPLYERHGFRVTAEHQLPGGPPIWLMWRPAS
ncbi:hypothetical protein DSM112329_04801 [Paraconexibacter sp. AEG42_29]|uniref:N-acetyltransferase domain-containing protein n=1 Tax=Paraconexibacter sp. AEG42_29 TaxID=2997339 RepID=A0AAU7B2K7_9ACTN